MDIFKKLAISICAVAVSLTVLFLFRTVPSGKLWESYRIVYVDDTSDSGYTEQVLASSGCKDVISMALQRFPLLLPALSPEVSFALADAESDSYLSRRNMYFFDKGGQYRLYYVPEQYIDEARTAVAVLQRENIVAGIDTQSMYPILIPTACIIFTLVLCVFSAHRAIFLCASVPFCFFAACVPFYPAASSACLLLYALFLVMQVWQRHGALQFILTNGTILLFALAAYVISWATSVRCGLLFMPALLGSVATLYALSLAQRIHEQKYHFVGVFIRPARAMPFLTKKSMSAMAACASSIVLLIAVSLFSIDFSYASPRLPRLQLPSATSSSITEKFPSLDEYVAWCWNTKTMPYRSLHEAAARTAMHPREGDTVAFPQYADGENGIAETVAVLTYDKQFYETTVAQIDNLSYPAIEKLLKAQGTSSSAGYSFLSAGSGGVLHIALMVVSLCVPLFFYVRSKMR